MVYQENTLGEYRLAIQTVSIPPERKSIVVLEKQRPSVAYQGFNAIVEAKELRLLRPKTKHAELSPTSRCPEDCGGCPDRASLHLGDPKKEQIPLEDWYRTIDELEKLGVEYFLLIGGTIDNHPYTPELMKYLLDKPAPVDVGWFTDGIMLLNPRTGDPTALFKKLAEQGKMIDLTTHVSADYLVTEGIREGGPILDPRKRWENEYGGSRYYKSAFSERLARKLIEMGAKRVVLNTAISAHNIDQILPVYEYAVKLQEYERAIGSPTVVLHTISPWIWRPHLARGDDPRNYDAATVLNESHTTQLQGISQYILEDTQRRITEEGPRVAANSSGFIAGLSDFAISQDVPYRHGSGEFAVQPDGVVRIDPVFINPRMLLHARNPYGYRDRDLDHNPFDIYNQKISGPIFPNLIQTTRGKVAWR